MVHICTCTYDSQLFCLIVLVHTYRELSTMWNIFHQTFMNWTLCLIRMYFGHAVLVKGFSLVLISLDSRFSQSFFLLVQFHTFTTFFLLVLVSMTKSPKVILKGNLVSRLFQHINKILQVMDNWEEAESCYSGTPLNGHPSKADTHNITDNSETPDCPSIHFNT